MLKLNGNISLHGSWKLDPFGGPASIPNEPEGPPPEEADFNVAQSGAAFVSTPIGTTGREGRNLAILGNTLFAGAPTTSSSMGRLVVYDYNGTTWAQSQIITPPTGNGTAILFGNASALNGTLAAIGAQSANAFGRVFLYSKNGASWDYSNTYLDSPQPITGAQFGAALDMDNTTLVVGAPEDKVESVTYGQVYVYTTSGSSWTHQATINAGDNLESSARFGWAVSLNGNTLAVGAPAENSNTGAVYIFTRSGSTWTKRARIVPTSPIAGGYFGASIKIVNGSMIVGAPGTSSDTGTATSSLSAAYLFSGSGATWTQDQVFRVANAAAPDVMIVDAGIVPANGGAIGQGVDITADGKNVLVSAFKATSGTSTMAGAIYVFEKVNGTWGPSALPNATSSLRPTTPAANEFFGFQAKFHNDVAVVGSVHGRFASRGGFYYFK